MSKLDRDEVRSIAFACGFEPKEGGDLREYVYLFADKLAEYVQSVCAQNADKCPCIGTGNGCGCSRCEPGEVGGGRHDRL